MITKPRYLKVKNASLVTITFLALCLHFIEACVAQASDKKATITVTVKGYGVTVDDARKDALRQAMQSALSQLVVVDREVNNDEVLQDRVLSTMNGFVDRVEEQSVTPVHDGFMVKTRITVSTERMGNFLGAEPESTDVDGLSLFSEVNRELEQRKSISKIFRRAWRGFPSTAITTTVVSVKPSVESPQAIDVKFSYKLSGEWLQTFESALKALAGDPYVLVFQADRDRASQCLRIYSDGAIAFRNNPQCDRNGQIGRLESRFIEVKSNIRPLCILSSTAMRCYVLPHAGYEGEFADITSSYDLLSTYQHNQFDFIPVAFDRSGSLTNNGSCCDVYKEKGKIGEVFVGSNGTGAARFNLMFASEANFSKINTIFAESIVTTITIDELEFDLSRTNRMVIVPVLKKDSAIIFDLESGVMKNSLKNAVLSSLGIVGSAGMSPRSGEREREQVLQLGREPPGEFPLQDAPKIRQAKTVSSPEVTPGSGIAEPPIAQRTKSIPSFDCALARTWVENTICANEQLAEFDSRMARGYLLQLKSSPDRSEQRAQQAAWRRHRRDQCDDVACLVASYQSRLRELQLGN